jgi:proteasome lid subunit RPN8/RPN11
MTTSTDRRMSPARPRMTGRVREVPLAFLDIPDPELFVEQTSADGRRVFIARSVLRDLAELERREHPNETAGLLFGRFFTDGTQPCTMVTELIPPEPGEVIGTPVTVTITADGARQMKLRARTVNPCADPCGWAHTHPTMPAYFSGTDRREQRAWDANGSVGLVMSGLEPNGAQYCVFVGPESTPTERVQAGAGQAPRHEVTERDDRPETQERLRRRKTKRPARVVVPRAVLDGARRIYPRVRPAIVWIAILLALLAWRNAGQAHDRAADAEARATTAREAVGMAQRDAAIAIAVAAGARRDARIARKRLAQLAPAASTAAGGTSQQAR